MIHIEKYSQVHIDFSVPDLILDLRKIKTDLPKEVIEQSPAICTIAPGEMDVFVQIGKKVDEVCHKHGAVFCGNWIFPDVQLDIVTDELDALIKSFESEKQNFLGRYYEMCNEWQIKYPIFSEILKKHKITLFQVESDLNFDYTVFAVGFHTIKMLEKALDTVFDRELNRASTDLKKVYVDISGADVIGSQIMHRVERVCEHMNDFRDLDPRFKFLPFFYRQATVGIISNGQITDPTKYRYIVSVMTDADLVRSFIENEVDEPEEMLRIYKIQKNLRESEGEF